MTINTNTFHVVEVEYSAEASDLRTNIWTMLQAQAHGFWFEHHGEDSLGRIHSHFPDVQNNSFLHHRMNQWRVYYCFRDPEDAQLLATYIAIIK